MLRLASISRKLFELVGQSKFPCRSWSAAASEAAEKTSLYDFHVRHKGKMVNFAGYLLPVQYADLGIAASHLHTRKHASIFDVSHMLQTYVIGKDSIECFESVCTADIRGLADNSGCLTVFSNDDGNILDDLIVTKVSPSILYVVSNAAMKRQDMNIISSAVENYKSKGKDVHVEFLSPSDRSLLAVQGPESVSALQKLTKTELGKLFFMNTTVLELGGIQDCRITRCGYTGEDGVEISVPSCKASDLTEALINIKEQSVKLAGLGARDSLRLEAGLCLYGSDIDDTTTPIEAGLAWLVAKRRRQEANFPGASKMNDQLKNGVQKRRVGFRMMSGPPARAGVPIIVDGKRIGVVTSGCPSPSLGGNVAMGYVEENYKKNGMKVDFEIREKLFPAEVAKMPFLPSKYYVKPKNG